MKIQDLFFIGLLAAIILSRKTKVAIIAGLFLLLASIPFFSLWIFFTAQRLVIYAFFLLVLSVITLLIQNRTHDTTD